MEIVHRFVIDLIRRHADPATFEALPVHLESAAGEPLGTYYGLNVLREIDALDAERAE